MTRLVLFAILLFSSLFSKASHISGGQITYKCLGNNLFEVKLTYFWDCQGGFNPGTNQFIDVDGCGTSFSFPVNQSSLTPGDGVLADGLCSNSGLTTCKKRIDYIGTMTLPSMCNQWTFSIGSCCRGGNITNITGGTAADYYHFATLNNLAAPCNNSPDISIATLPNFCVNQSACFNLGATEQDGNTLSYAFVSAYQTATTFVNYSTGYSGTSPIVGITIDPVTGQINFMPTLIGDFVISVQITERDANGVVIGTIMRDFQVIVTNCNNQTVTCGQGGIANVSSGTVPPGSANSLQICENIPFCFDVFFTDPDVNDSVKISSPNIATTLPGSSMVMTYTPGIKNKIKATICWTPPQGSSGLNTSFVLIVKDNACPVPGTQVLNYFIDVLPATSAGPDRTICGAQSASITATGSSTVFAWSDLAGNAIPVGPDFTCNPCRNPIIKPAVTSTYVVTNIGGGTNCKNKDTLVIAVAPDFTLTAGVSVASSCLNSAVQFTSAVNPAGPGYSYTWSPSAPLTTTNTANTSATFSLPGAYNYTVTSASALGCTKQSNNISFTAQPISLPIFTVVPTNTTVCINTAVPMSINMASVRPTVCGLATSGCATTATITVGTGFQVNGNQAFPTPYSNYYCSSRFQMLFKASELTAAGLIAGKISSLTFGVSSLNSLNRALPHYTIKMKCTSATIVSSSNGFDNTGLSQVYFANSYMPTPGVNTHNFNQAYEWDGTSNLLVDICYDRSNLNGNYVSNGSASALYSTTPFASVVYDGDDYADMCGSTSFFPSTSFNRPNVRFGNCSSMPPPSSYSYSWFPVTGLNDPNISNPIATLSSSIMYSVVITPTAAATCSNVSTTNLTVINPVTPTITPVNPLCNNAVPFTLTVDPIVGVWAGSGISATGLFTPSLALLGNNTYTYTVGSGTCVATGTTSIAVTQFIPATITGTMGPYCIYHPAEDLQPIAQYVGGTWSGNGVSGSFFTPSVAGAGIHSIIYSTDPAPSGLCPDQAFIDIQVNDKPEVNALTDKTDGCNPVMINFYTTTTTTGTATWDFGDGSPVGSGLITNHLYTTPGVYLAAITYTDAIGCVDTTYILTAITDYSVPVASFEPSLIETTVVDGQLSFENRSTILNTNSYQWNIGELATSDSVNTSYFFAHSGNYAITLAATNSYGCVDDTTVIVKVRPDVVLYVPNAFTPGNGDGKNDLFEISLPPTGVDYSTFNLTIYDRWGDVMYKTNDVNKFWNGSKNNSGSVLKQETYVWKITFYDEQRKYYERLGHVTLIR